MSKLNVKKHHERFLLEQFFEAAGLTAEIVDESGEAPDFIIRIDHQLVGVEVTELFRSYDDQLGALQAQESIARRIVSKARQIYVASSAQHAHVFVLFASNYDLRNVNRDQIAAALAAFVKTQELPDGQHVQWRQNYVNSPLPEAITHVNMLRVPTSKMAHWSVAAAGWQAPMTGDILQRRINEKAELLPKYKLRVATNWLLLVSDGTKPSQFFDAPSDQIALTISSPFARTIYFGQMKRTIVELGNSSK